MAMTEKEILEIDFYDLVGISEIFMTDDDKIKHWNSLTWHNLKSESYYLKKE